MTHPVWVVGWVGLTVILRPVSAKLDWTGTGYWADLGKIHNPEIAKKMAKYVRGIILNYFGYLKQSDVHIVLWLIFFYTLITILICTKYLTTDPQKPQ